MKVNLNILILLLLCFSSVYAFSEAENKKRDKKATYQRYSGEQQKKILVLNSYHHGYHWTDRLMEGIFEAFDSCYSCDLYIEYMDTKRHSDTNYFRHLYDIYKLKYPQYEFDIIISTDDNALNFLLKYRNDLFGEVPVVFCGANEFDPAKLIGHKYYTGLEETYDVKGTIDLMVSQNEDVSHIVVISDSTLTGTIFRKSIEDVVRENQFGISFEYLNNQSLEEMEARLNNLEETDLVLWTIYLRQPNGLYISSRESVAFTVDNAPGPVYCIWDVVGLGVAGGKVTSPEYQGSMAAEIASDVLAGADIEAIKIQKSPVHYKLDHQRLVDNDIDVGTIPEGAIVVNKRFSFYETYKSLFWTVLSVIILLVAIVLVLLYLMRKRKQAELKLLDVNRELKMMTTYLENMNAELEVAKGRAMESDRLKTVFLQNISHEIRTPMNGILGFTEVLKIKEMSREEQVNYLNIIETSSNRLLNLMNDLISISKAESNQLEFYYSHVNVAEVLSNMYQNYKSEVERKGVDFAFYPDFANPVVETDRSKLEQIVTSLLNNAIKFTEKGHIKFGYKKIDSNQVEFWFEDTGSGIHEKYQTIIFDRFGQGEKSYYRNDDGCGLGLAIAKAYIESMGGKIWFKTKVNEGSTFFFTLPLKQ